MQPTLLRDPRRHFATGRQPTLPRYVPAIIASWWLASLAINTIEATVTPVVCSSSYYMSSQFANGSACLSNTCRMPGAAAGASMQLPAPPPPSLEAVTAATASGFQPRAAMPPPPPPQPVNASAIRVKVEAPRAPHMYPSQSLFPRESASISDAVSGLKALASHTDSSNSTPPLQPMFRQQSAARGFELPALHIPQRQTSYQELHHRISPVLRPGEAAVIKVEPGSAAHPQLLPPPLITRRVTVGETAHLRQQHGMQDQRLPSMAHQSPPLVSLLGRKNKRGEARRASGSPVRLQWEDASHGRLDPTASPPRPTGIPVTFQAW